MNVFEDLALCNLSAGLPSLSRSWLTHEQDEGKEEPRKIHNMNVPMRVASNTFFLIIKDQGVVGESREVPHEQDALQTPLYGLKWGPTREMSS